MSDELAIPACLDLRIPEIRAKHDQALRDWKPGSVKMRGDAKPRTETDSKGRQLPAGMDEGSWALLRSQERETEKKETADKKERFAALAAMAADKRELKRAAREAKGDALAKRKR